MDGTDRLQSADLTLMAEADAGFKSGAVATFLEAEVPGWVDDDVKVAALFKAFSGQREDWQGRLDIWKVLVVKVARHLGDIVIDAEEVQHQWFSRGGLLPLCLNDVLLEMLTSGELLRMDEQFTTQHSRIGWVFSGLSHAFTWAGQTLLGLQGSQANHTVTGKLVVSVLLKEKVSQIFKVLTDGSWKSDCVVTMKSFVDLCVTVDDAQVIMHYLLGNRLACHLCINGEERIEGLKISLVQSSVSALSEVDFSMLQLFWTSEKMKQRFDVLDQRVLQLRESTIKSMKVRDKQAALRHLKSMKTLSASRDKCGVLMEKIQQILEVIFDAEATKKVSEAIQLGNHAMKEHHVTLEEVEVQLKELDESITLERQIGDVFAGASVSSVIDNQELEGEFASLEAEIKQEALPSEGEVALPPVPSATPPVKHPDEGSLEKFFSKLELEPA